MKFETFPTPQLNNIQLSHNSHGLYLITMQESLHHNQLTPAFIQQLEQSISFVENQSDSKIIILTGQQHYFATGDDEQQLIAIYQGGVNPPEQQLYQFPLMAKLPIIAAVQGHAIGLGWAMAMVCDYTIFARNTYYWLPSNFYSLRIKPDFSTLLTHHFGMAVSKTVLFNDQMYQGEQLNLWNKELLVCEAKKVLNQAIILGAQLITEQTRTELIYLKKKRQYKLKEQLEQKILTTQLYQQHLVGNKEVMQRILSRFSVLKLPLLRLEKVLQTETAITIIKPSEMKQPSQAMIKDQIIIQLCNLLAQQLKCDRQQINIYQRFSRQGLDTDIHDKFVHYINCCFGLNLQASSLEQYPSVIELAETISQILPELNQHPTVLKKEHIQPLSLETIYKTLQRLLATELGIEEGQLQTELTFLEQGLDSVVSMSLIEEINETFVTDFDTKQLYKTSTLASLSIAISEAIYQYEKTEKPIVITTADHVVEKITEQHFSPQLFIFSGADPQTVLQLIQEFRYWLASEQLTKEKWKQLAQQLQLKQQALAYRIAITAIDTVDLQQQLAHISTQTIYKITEGLVQTVELALDIQDKLRKQQWQSLQELWLEGMAIDWWECYPYLAKKLPLSVYPFRLNTPQIIPIESDEDEVWLARCQWQDQTLPHHQSTVHHQHAIVLVGFDLLTMDKLRTELPDMELFLLYPQANLGLAEQYSHYARELFLWIQAKLQQVEQKVVTCIHLIIEQSQTQQLNTYHIGHCLPGLIAILKVAHIEQPLFDYQLLLLPKQPTEVQFYRIKQHLLLACGQEIRYAAQRQVKQLQVFPMQNVINEHFWREQGVYLITGGLGDIGYLLAQEIIQHCKQVNIILTGRRQLNNELKEKLEQLRTHPTAKIDYITWDVGDEDSVNVQIDSIIAQYGKLTGVLHCAGVIQNDFIVYKSIEEFEATLTSKVQGVVNLDQATQHLPLEFFIVFSSISAELGNVGQVDYACGNHFMDYFMQLRQQLVKEKIRSGRCLSINWPLWRDGHMMVDQAILDKLYAFGLGRIHREQAFSVLNQAYASNETQVIVACGKQQAVEQLLLGKIPIVSSNIE